MAQTLLLTVQSYEIEAGAGGGSPSGLRIRIATQEGETLRLHFLLPDSENANAVLGFRASDGALAVFFQRRDFTSYVVMLDQVHAIYLRVGLNDSDQIEVFALSTVPFPTQSPIHPLIETDEKEHKRLLARNKQV